MLPYRFFQPIIGTRLFSHNSPWQRDNSWGWSVAATDAGFMLCVLIWLTSWRWTRTVHRLRSRRAAAAPGPMVSRSGTSIPASASSSSATELTGGNVDIVSQSKGLSHGFSEPESPELWGKVSSESVRFSESRWRWAMLWCVRLVMSGRAEGNVGRSSSSIASSRSILKLGKRAVGAAVESEKRGVFGRSGAGGGGGGKLWARPGVVLSALFVWNKGGANVDLIGLDEDVIVDGAGGGGGGGGMPLATPVGRDNGRRGGGGGGGACMGIQGKGRSQMFALVKQSAVEGSEARTLHKSRNCEASWVYKWAVRLGLGRREWQKVGWIAGGKMKLLRRWRNCRIDGWIIARSTVIKWSRTERKALVTFDSWVRHQSPHDDLVHFKC